MIVGSVLLVGLGYVIYKVWMIPPQNFDEFDSGSAVASADRLENLPSASIDFAPLAGDGNKDSGIAIRQRPKLHIYQGVNPPQEEGQDLGSHDPILESEDVVQVVETLLTLREEWKGKSNPIILMKNQRRAKLTRRLMELDISDAQLIFALSEYIESVTVLDMVLCQEKAEASEVRNAIGEIFEKYQQHESSPIRARACLANLAVPLHDYSRDRKIEALDEFLARLDKYSGRVFEDKPSTSRLCRMVLWLRRSRDWDGVALPYCVALIEKMKESSNPEISDMVKPFSERVYFEHLELNDLVSRIDQGDIDSRSAVQEFFEGLDAEPDCRIEFFQIAISVVEQVKGLDQKEDFELLMQWLRKIVGKISSEDSKAIILPAFEQLEALPWGPSKVEPISMFRDLPGATSFR